MQRHWGKNWDKVFAAKHTRSQETEHRSVLQWTPREETLQGQRAPQGAQRIRSKGVRHKGDSVLSKNNKWLLIQNLQDCKVFLYFLSSSITSFSFGHIASSFLEQVRSEECQAYQCALWGEENVTKRKLDHCSVLVIRKCCIYIMRIYIFIYVCFIYMTYI